MLHSSDVGPQCAGCMEEEARELQQAQKLECVKVVCSGMQCEPGSDLPVGVVGVKRCFRLLGDVAIWCLA